MKNLINLFLISSFIFCACPDVAPNSNYSFIEDDCGNCWLPYCYNQQTHSVSYDLTEDECNYMWVNPGDSGDPYYNSYCDSCPNGYTEDSCGNCWNSYCYTFFNSGIDGDPAHSVYYDLTEFECNELGFGYYVPGVSSSDPYYDSNCSNESTCNGCMTGCVSYVMTNYGYTESEAEYWCFSTADASYGCSDSCYGNTLDCNGTVNGNNIPGDLNSTGIINVADVVYLVNFILGASNLDVSCGDINNDGSVDVSDVVALINIILSDRLLVNIDAVNSKLIISDNSLRLESDGFVQGIHLTLSHGSNFNIELVDAFVSEYRTNFNKTTLMIVTDGSHSITDIATFTGDVIINSVHVVNQSGDVFVDQVVKLSSIKVSVVGPNPFNPSTQVSIVIPEAGFVSVNVYNILGEKVATLVDGYMNANSMGHVVNFNASHLASGVYLVQAVSAGDISTQKLMLIK